MHKEWKLTPFLIDTLIIPESGADMGTRTTIYMEFVYSNLQMMEMIGNVPAILVLDDDSDAFRWRTFFEPTEKQLVASDRLAWLLIS